MIRLFCFPYAGASATFYTSWAKALASPIELRPVEFAGRGRRINEPCCSTIEQLVDDVFHSIKDELNGVFAFFGHSLGAMTAYELTMRLHTLGLEMPRHVFISGRGAPHLNTPPDDKIHHLAEDKFIEKIFQLGGTHQDVKNNLKIFKLFLPILRCDTKIAETDFIHPGIQRLPTPLTVLYGRSDLTEKEAAEWKLHSQRVSLHPFEGGHFYLFEHMNSIHAILNKTLLEVSVQ